jgi:hypothetical protein
MLQCLFINSIVFKEKAFKIGYYRHLGVAGLLDLGASGSFVMVQGNTLVFLPSLLLGKVKGTCLFYLLLSLSTMRGADASGSFTSPFLSLS